MTSISLSSLSIFGQNDENADKSDSEIEDLERIGVTSCIRGRSLSFSLLFVVFEEVHDLKYVRVIYRR